MRQTKGVKMSCMAVSILPPVKLQTGIFEALVPWSLDLARLKKRRGQRLDRRPFRAGGQFAKIELPGSED